MSYWSPSDKERDLKVGQLKGIRNRILLMVTCSFVAFVTIGLRLVDIMCFQSDFTAFNIKNNSGESTRGKICDAHGNVIATTLTTPSLYANPSVIMNAKEAAIKVCLTFPELDYSAVYKKMTSQKGFVWIKRSLTPKQQQDVMALGIPGLDFQYEKKRVYPQGRLFSHIVGMTDIDGVGIAGVEKQFDSTLVDSAQDIQLSLSLPIQHAVYSELKKGVETFQAEGGSAIVVSLETGKVLSMVSLPDFDPNDPKTLTHITGFNRNTLGVYELGSTMKVLNTALFLEHGEGGADAVFDVTKPLRIGRFTIRDFRGGKQRPLTVEEIFQYSSNIGSALMALAVGPEKQYEFFKDLGLFDKPSIELPEKGRPLFPKKVSKAHAMTMAFGHGIAITPIHFVQSISRLLNKSNAPVSILESGNPHPINQKPLFKIHNQKALCHLMHSVIEKGTAKKARVKGYLIGGKAGTAEIIEGGRYVKDGKNLTSFVGVFPINNPQYIVFMTLDKPKAQSFTHGFTAAGWNAAPVGGNIIRRVATVMGISPNF